jgi:hypothetical protein
LAIDNTFVVPLNVDLVVKYHAHINVEKANYDGMHKYLFKYVIKGLIALGLAYIQGLHHLSHQISLSMKSTISLSAAVQCHMRLLGVCFNMIFTIQIQ